MSRLQASASKHKQQAAIMFDDQEREFVVLVNGEEQYSLWPADREAPDGWLEAGARGDKASCLKFVDENWVDMRPLSLREKMAQ